MNVAVLLVSHPGAHEISVASFALRAVVTAPTNKYGKTKDY